MRVERRRTDDGTRAVLFGIALLVVAFLGFGGGYLVGSGKQERAAALAPSPTVAPTTPSPSPPATSPTASPDPDADLLTNGRYLAQAEEVVDGAPPTLAFDLAYFLTGREAAQAAADHGDQLETDYYIVNDNPLVRELPVSPFVQVSYVPESACCELQPGLFEPWAGAVNEESPSDYAGKDAYWWITVRAGQIVRIEEQYLA